MGWSLVYGQPFHAHWVRGLVDGMIDMEWDGGWNGMMDEWIGMVDGLEWWMEWNGGWSGMVDELRSHVIFCA